MAASATLPEAYKKIDAYPPTMGLVILQTLHLMQECANKIRVFIIQNPHTIAKGCNKVVDLYKNKIQENFEILHLIDPSKSSAIEHFSHEEIHTVVMPYLKWMCFFPTIYDQSHAIGIDLQIGKGITDKNYHVSQSQCATLQQSFSENVKTSLSSAAPSGTPWDAATIARLDQLDREVHEILKQLDK